MSFLDTTAVKHLGALLSYEIMIPTLYLGRAGLNLATEADRTAYLIAAMQFFGGLATALGTLYQNAYSGITKLAGTYSCIGVVVLLKSFTLPLFVANACTLAATHNSVLNCGNTLRTHSNC